MKKLKAVLSAAMMTISCLAGTATVPATAEETGAYINYAEALQKSLYFYECQQAGPLPEWNRVEWRADSTVDDFIKGGWYDAGDHVKFNLPMAYSASMIAWGLYEYPEGVEACGEMENYVNNLTFVLDYLAACDLGDEVVFQVGNGQQDHTWWGPVELYEYGMAENGNTEPRPYYAGTKCSAAFGEMAAALAAGACALEGRSDKTEYYLEHAENIFKIADAAKSDAEYADSDASGFYRSSHFYDELFWAANWLYKATGNQEYLDKATSYIPNLDKELGSDELKYTWSHCWDDVMQGGMVLYAQNTGNSTYISRVKKHLDYLVNDAEKLDGGAVYIHTWGCLRYSAACGFVAAVASDTLDLGDESKYVDFSKTQADYILGDNPLNMSFVVGYDETSPLNAHHRAAHSSWNNSVYEPVDNRHILYGALVGGPTQAGEYEDDRNNYINNEVADDYNAGFTSLMAAMIQKYGGETDPTFPLPEERTPEFFVEAQMKQSSGSGVSLSLKITNHTAWPARVVDNISYRYYFDASEIINAGYNASDIVVRVDRDQALMYGADYAAVISDIQHYDGTVYYIEVSYPNGEAFLPISEGRHQCETMLALVYPNYGSGWDASNDYSNTDFLDTEDPVVTDKITVYQNGVLIYGTEPDGTTAGSVIPTEPTEESTEPATEPATEPTEAPTTEVTTDITVGDLTIRVVEAEVDSYPTKTNYTVGEELDLSGLAMTVNVYHYGELTDPICENASPLDYPEVFVVDTSEFDSTKAGTYTITITSTDEFTRKYYWKIEESFEVTVSNALTAPDDPELLANAKWGDVNVDGTVDAADIVALNMYLLNASVSNVTEQGIVNANCNYDNAVDSTDSTLIMNYVSMLVEYSKLGPQS